LVVQFAYHEIVATK